VPVRRPRERVPDPAHKLTNVYPGDRPADHKLLDLLGALEEVVDLELVFLEVRKRPLSRDDVRAYLPRSAPVRPVVGMKLGMAALSLGSWSPADAHDRTIGASARWRAMVAASQMPVQ